MLSNYRYCIVDDSDQFIFNNTPTEHTHTHTQFARSIYLRSIYFGTELRRHKIHPCFSFILLNYEFILRHWFHNRLQHCNRFKTITICELLWIRRLKCHTPRNSYCCSFKYLICHCFIVFKFFFVLSLSQPIPLVAINFFFTMYLINLSSWNEFCSFVCTCVTKGNGQHFCCFQHYFQQFEKKKKMPRADFFYPPIYKSPH